MTGDMGSRAWLARLIAPALAAGLCACASGPPPPDWQVNARLAIDDAVAAHLLGERNRETGSFERARRELAATGRPDLMARAELMRCAAQVASLAAGPCEGFERLRGEAAAPELAYAGYLAARVLPSPAIERLPGAHRDIAAAVAGGRAVTAASAQGIADPLSRLIALAVLFQAGQASPALIALAVDTASAQGWRRPLLAWLGVQAELARRAGDTRAASRLQRRIELIEGPRPADGPAEPR